MLKKLCAQLKGLKKSEWKRKKQVEYRIYLYDDRKLIKLFKTMLNKTKKAKKHLTIQLQ